MSERVDPCLDGSRGYGSMTNDREAAPSDHSGHPSIHPSQYIANLYFLCAWKQLWRALLLSLASLIDMTP